MRRPLAALAALCLVGCLADGAANPARPPNLLLVIVDCLRGDALSANGYHRPTTPNLDALAGEGVNFRSAFSQASWTRPSLPTILTGLYPSEHGLFDLADERAEHAPALAEAVVTAAERLAAAGYANAMFGEQHKLAPGFGLGQGFAVWHHRTGGAINIRKKLLDWTEGLGEQPFFAYLHYLELHWPYCPPRELRGRFDEGTSRLKICADWRRLRDDIRTGAHQVTEADRQLLRARYDEELLGVDQALGELFADLRARGVWDETLVVVTSDHGEEFLEHGAFFHGQSLHDELIHVPLIVKPPASWGVPGERVVDHLVELRDLPATLLDAAALSPPPPGTTSLLPWVRGVGQPSGGGLAGLWRWLQRPREPVAPRRFVVAESMDHVAVRTERWKLIAAKRGASYALYDLTTDAGETRNQADEQPEQLGEMRRLLAGWRQSLRPVAASAVDIDAETREGLEALGYIQ